MNKHLLTPDEYMIFKNAMESEEINCENIDGIPCNGSYIKLVPLCHSIKKKIKDAVSKEDLIELLQTIKDRLVYTEDQAILDDYLEDLK